jgi:hypothetical protein
MRKGGAVGPLEVEDAMEKLKVEVETMKQRLEE